MTQLEGTYDKTVYANEENGWTVGRFIPHGGKNSPVTIVGHFNVIVPGEQLKLTGKWDSHPKYGAQFVVDQCESVLPATLSGIEKYLSSGLIAGIGPVMAQRLVAKFGQRTIEVIDCEPKRLREVEGIGEKRVQMISEGWEEQKATRGIILSLQSHKISTSLAIRIYRHYGEESLKILKEDPYRLAMDVHGIGFKTADDIAKQLGMPPDSPQRAKAGLLYVLQEASQKGHVYYPKSLLLECAVPLLSADELIVREALEGLLSDRKYLVADQGSDPDLPIYLPSLYRAEGKLTGRIAALAESGGSRFLDKAAVERFLSAYERFRQISFASKQRRAISTALTQSFSIITGGPGTGKTTLVSAIVQIARKGGLRVALAAPTGRAAKRLTESTRLEAKTIHRLLEYQPANGGFRYKSRDLPCDLLVVDEVSMLDTPLAYRLLEAVPSKAQVVFVGDVDQLPSVGPGNVLRDLIESDVIPVVKLDEVYRQGRESSIVFNAHRINQGEFPVVEEKGGDFLTDFYFVEKGEPEAVQESILSLCRERIPKRFGFDPVTDIQILSPMYRGTVGIQNLNLELQKMLNPHGALFERGAQSFRVGDKVIQLRNNYDLDVYNGDIGRIIDIKTEERCLLIRFDQKVIRYDFRKLDDVALAYCISVHKSQGSEYPAVIFPLLTQHYIMLQRNLLYTALTRARQLFVLIGTKQAVRMAIANADPQHRYSGLKDRLLRELRSG